MEGRRIKFYIVKIVFFTIFTLGAALTGEVFSQDSKIVEDAASNKDPLSDKRLLLTLTPAKPPVPRKASKTSEAIRHSSNYYINKGNEYTEKAKYTEAEKEYERALTLDSENIFAQINMGVICTNQERYLEAAKHFEKALEIDPECAPAHLDLAVIYDECLFDKTRATLHYKKFLEYDSTMDFKKREKVRRWIKEME